MSRHAGSSPFEPGGPGVLLRLVDVQIDVDRVAILNSERVRLTDTDVFVRVEDLGEVIGCEFLIYAAEGTLPVTDV